MVHHCILSFGHACDDLIRDIASHLPPAQVRALHGVIEPWPFTDDGQPRETDPLFQRLTALSASLGAPLPPEPASGSAARSGAFLALLPGGAAPHGDAAMGWEIGPALAGFLLMGGAAAVWTVRRARPR